MLGNALAQMVQRYKRYSGKWLASTVQFSVTSLHNLANIVVGREYGSGCPAYRAALHQNRHNWKPLKWANSMAVFSSEGSLPTTWHFFLWISGGRATMWPGCWDKWCGSNGKKKSMEVVLRRFYCVSLPSPLKFQPGLGSAALAKARHHFLPGR